MTSDERQLEEELLAKLRDLKYEHRPDIRDRATLEKNFRDKFQTLNHVQLTDGEFTRLLDEIVRPDVFTTAHTLRNRNSFTRDDGTPLNYTLVNIQDWCKNTFEVVSQLRINTDYSHHRYDVVLLINGVPCAQIELKTLGINPARQGIKFAHVWGGAVPLGRLFFATPCGGADPDVSEMNNSTRVF